MAWSIAKFIVAALLSGWAGLACASNPVIDIFDISGVPGTGGYTNIVGPCYCEESAFFSPIMLLQPGTYDFGEVREHWVQSGATPDGGADQPNLYLLFAPVEVSGSYPDNFPYPPYYNFPATALCNQDDAACNGNYQNAYIDFDLVYTVAPGDNAIVVGLIGNDQYTSPLPEPSTIVMLLLGLGLVSALAKSGARRHGVAEALAP